MSRLSNAIMTDAFARQVSRPMSNLELGGQGGWAPNLTEWVNNQAYVSRPLICIMLEAPKMFSVMPDSYKWIASLKALFELHAKSIEGMNASLKPEFDTHDVGGAGEKQHEVVDMKREASVPKFTFVEKYGRPIQTLLNYWMRYGMMDAEAKYALLGTLGNPNIKDLLADWYTATCLFIVPDPLHKTVDKAWITTNMMPQGEGDVTAKRDLSTGQEILTLDIEFTGLSQYGLGVNKFAQTILDQISTTNADPSMRASFIDRVSADVLAAANGYRNDLQKVGTQAVTRMGA